MLCTKRPTIGKKQSSPRRPTHSTTAITIVQTTVAYSHQAQAYRWALLRICSPGAIVWKLRGEWVGLQWEQLVPIQAVEELIVSNSAVRQQFLPATVVTLVNVCAEAQATAAGGSSIINGMMEWH